MAAVKNLKYVVTSALFRMGKPATGREYTWLEQVAIDYLSEVAPMDGNVSLKVVYATLGDGSRVFTLPPDAVRLSRVALKVGNRVWTLTMDRNLAIPPEFFSCDEQSTNSNNQEYWSMGPYWNYINYPQYGQGGGRNVNYYRVEGRNVFFDNNIPNGNLIIEYLGNGSEISGDTLLDAAYIETFRLYLISQYYLYKGTREEKSMYKEIAVQYEAAKWEANIIAKAPRIAEIIDAMAQSSEFNLG